MGGAKMKSYTDIEQSKRLSEILPTESADMYYQYVLPKSDKIKHNPENGNPVEALEWYNKGYTHFGKDPLFLEEYCIPCWSLAAMLNYLREIDFFPEINIGEHSVTMSISYYNEDETGLLSPIQNIKTKAESFIDACYEMIIKLDEQYIL